MITLYRTDESIIGEFQVDSVKEAVEFAVRQCISLECADLEGADLEGANLVGANLAVADLEGANLVGADLEGANLAGANFEGANLAFADLEDVSLAFANLIEASLEGANLKRAGLKGADLKGVNLKSTNLDYAAISIQSTSTEAIVDDRFAAQLAHLLTRQDYSNCSEEVKRDIDIIKSLSITNLLAKYRNDVKPI